MGVFTRPLEVLREWTERDDGTLEGPALSTDELSGGVTGSISVSKIFGERIASKSAGGDTSVDFTSITSDYDRYIIDITGLTFSTDSGVQVRVSSDGGSTFDSGAGGYLIALQAIDSAGGTRDIGQSRSEILLTDLNVGSGAGESMSATMAVSQPTNANTKTLFRCESESVNGSGDLYSVSGGGLRDAAASHDAIRVFFDNAADSGELDLYGVMS